jgi:hypothetical protein
MLTQPQIDKLKEHAGLGWITALTSVAVRKRVNEGALQLSLFDQKNLVLVAVRKGAKMAVHSGPPRRLCSGLSQWRQGQALRARYARP